MTVLDRRVMRDEKITHLKQGRSVYAESSELIRLIKRGIDRNALDVKLEYTNGGCWFTPNENA
ncbi:hypothetical protein ACLIBG_12520 [Virgibacillus sp. W0181]|uniref:hypothetical protein n=1 Tax=Virgibacillus sp. W0181 TaxID=3391581 RepID=UPI003F45EB03